MLLHLPQFLNIPPPHFHVSKSTSITKSPPTSFISSIISLSPPPSHFVYLRLTSFTSTSLHIPLNNFPPSTYTSASFLTSLHHFLQLYITSYTSAKMPTHLHHFLHIYITSYNSTLLPTPPPQCLHIYITSSTSLPKPLNDFSTSGYTSLPPLPPHILHIQLTSYTSTSFPHIRLHFSSYIVSQG